MKMNKMFSGLAAVVIVGLLTVSFSVPAADKGGAGVATSITQKQTDDGTTFVLVGNFQSFSEAKKPGVVANTIYWVPEGVFDIKQAAAANEPVTCHVATTGAMVMDSILMQSSSIEPGGHCIATQFIKTAANMVMDSILTQSSSKVATMKTGGH